MNMKQPSLLNQNAQIESKEDSSCLNWRGLWGRLSLNDELLQQVKASESPRSISILASSSVSGVTASWG